MLAFLTTQRATGGHSFGFEHRAAGATGPASLRTKGLFTAEAAEGTGDRTGLLVEFDQSDAIFTHPTDKRIEDYVTVRLGELR
jgi:hypothetical protein